MKTIFSIMIFFLTAQILIHAQEKKALKIIPEFYSAIDEGNTEKAGMYLTNDFKAYLPSAPTALDKKGFIGFCQGFKTGFPDMKHELVHVFADDNDVAVNGIFIGTNTGSMMGNPATQNKVKLPFNTIMEMNGKGQIKLLKVQYDNKAVETQLMAGMPNPKMRGQQSVKDLFHLMDAGQAEKFTDYCSADFMISNPFLPAPAPLPAFQGILKAQKTAFPDLKHEVVEMCSDGKYVFSYGMFTGTNTGSMMGNPPTGNKVKLPFIVMDEINDQGKISRRNVQFDLKSFESQLMSNNNVNNKMETSLREMFQASDEGDINKFLSYYSKDVHAYFIGHQNNTEEMAARVRDFKTAFPDIKRNVEELVVNGNAITVRGTLTGTNKGKYMGKAATNNPVKVSWLGLYHFGSDGKIESGWVEFDSAALAAQLNKKSMPGKQK
jgi:predicted ester cyclase